MTNYAEWTPNMRALIGVSQKPKCYVSQRGEQERKFAQLLESLGEKKSARDQQKQDADEKVHQYAAEHIQILSDLVSSGVNADINGSVSQCVIWVGS